MLSSDDLSYYDAHLHLQDERLKEVITGLSKVYEEEHVAGVVVNGTRPEDWPAVLQLAVDYSFVIPSFGLHPWYVNEAPADWQNALIHHLNEADKLNKPAGIGECGLDKWIRDYDLDAQKRAFLWQLELAAERDLPLSIHCLKAWGTLYDVLRDVHKPKCGFLLHSYGGPADMVDAFVDQGAYFSFSGYFAREDKSAKLEAFRKVPLERLLIETDAPDMSPPIESIVYPLFDENEKRIINHPGNIGSVYRLAAHCLEYNEEELRKQVADNVQRFLGLS
ncbi:TatD family hydrolase [Rubellicoccus peritrichatus]|uniref:TatD family hydrolase n=1 Tax=Rubellicoccus peritrichatus TaxID=3080537 RepID=A0AAQ3QS79_9BACT|nr:TatD family hydrolase [Puniceicoccus sp. CR14]WOO42128.1 TatD family hydrolase [Puniceicoccus sp. CR14]